MAISLKVITFLIMTAVAFDTVKAAKFLQPKPDFLKPCHLADSNFNKCFSKNIEVLFHEWKDGIPGYKASGSFDPLHVKRVLLTQNAQDAIAFNADLHDVIFTGVSNMIVKDASFNPKTLVSQLKFFLPKLRLDCDYKLNGRILNLALNGNGKAFAEIENFSMSLNIKLKPRDENDYTFTDIEKLKLVIGDVGGLRIHFSNLFNGQKALEESTNALINENWRDFFEVLRPAISQSVEAVMTDRLSKVFSYVPANYFIEDISTAAELNG